VEVAEGGTLFLDEIGDITPAMQVKLLRLLQERKYERLGGTETRSADVRFIAATHRDLESMVKSGDFREDLFYRLNVVPLWLPPLRGRGGDVSLLARAFCRRFGDANGRPQASLGDDAVRALEAERWPGNVRQLQNFIERLIVLCDDDLITADDVRREMSQGKPITTHASRAPSTLRTADITRSQIVPLTEEVRQAERKALVRALKYTRGNRTLAARILCISRATLYNKLVEYGLS
jgi:two-component system response regulator AtoC